MRVFILDFEDSFTHNIYSEFLLKGHEAKVIEFKNLEAFLSVPRRNCVYVYGPGPGHINEYEHLFSLIAINLQNDQIFHYGICLGHQIISNLFGAKIRPSANIMHGRSEKMLIPSWDVFDHSFQEKIASVMRYNSLCTVIDGETNFQVVTNEDNELLMTYSMHIFTTQFHPESVGTDCRNAFFDVVKFWQYNRRDEYAEHKNRRNLRQKNNRTPQPI